MTTFNLMSESFEVAESSKKFLESYLDRVDSYIRKHSLDMQLKEDLSERLLEKLLEARSENDLTEKRIVNIVNSLGEPEDIFRDLFETDRTWEGSRITKADVKDFFKKEFHRNGKTGIILGVCAWLSETFEINPIWMRLLFLSLIPAYGFIILIYFILGVLLPDSARTGEDRSEKSEIRENTSETSSHASRRSILASAASGISSILVTLIRALAKTAVFCVLVGIAFFLFGSSIGVIGLAGFANARPVIDNMAIFSAMPNWLPIIALGCGIAGIILAIMAGAKGLGKNIGSAWLVILCFAVLGAGMFSAVQTGTVVLSGFQNTYSSGSESIFSVQSGSLLTIDVDGMGNRFHRGRWLDLGRNNPSIELDASPDDAVHVEIMHIIRTTDASRSQSVLAAIVPTQATLKNNTLSLSTAGGADFRDVVPFSILEREVRILAPKTVKVRIIGDYRNAFGVYRWAETSESMRSHGLYTCDDLERFYDSKMNSFICHSNEAIERAVRDERESFIRDQQADFFGEDVDGWVRVKSVEDTGSWVFVVTWRDDDRAPRKLQVSFSGGYDEEHNPIVIKKQILTGSGIIK